MRIGEAARELGVEAHVLRHWEDTGVVVPERSAAGQRDYDREAISRLRIVRACQSAGMSLAEIRLVLRRNEASRVEVITRQVERIKAQRARLADAQLFLEHVVDCTHDLLTRCEDCTRYAETVRDSAPGAVSEERDTVCS